MTPNMQMQTKGGGVEKMFSKSTKILHKGAISMAHEKNQNLTEMNEQELGNVTGGAALLAGLAALAGLSENEAEQCTPTAEKPKLSESAFEQAMKNPVSVKDSPFIESEVCEFSDATSICKFS